MIRHLHNRRLTQGIIALLVLYAALPLISGYRLSCHAPLDTVAAADENIYRYECPLCYIAVWDGHSNGTSYIDTYTARQDETYIAIATFIARTKISAHAHSIRSPPSTFLV